MTVAVKICGIRSVESALAAIDAGADFIGLNFVPTSKRKINEGTAREIVEAVEGQAMTVGVFQNADSAYVNTLARSLDLDFVQLHGSEDAAYCNQMQTKVIKALSLKPNDDVSALVREMKELDVSLFLLDRAVQGSGSVIPVQVAEHLAREFEVFLAGGLLPDTVAGVVKKVRPFAVDVAGGIETDGEEDIVKIKQFIMNAKGVIL